MKTREELGEELCKYCDPFNEHSHHVKNGTCEGSWCDDAYEFYTESIDENGEDDENN